MIKKCKKMDYKSYVVMGALFLALLFAVVLVPSMISAHADEAELLFAQEGKDAYLVEADEQEILEPATKNETNFDVEDVDALEEQEALNQEQNSDVNAGTIRVENARPDDSSMRGTKQRWILYEDYGEKDWEYDPDQIAFYKITFFSDAVISYCDSVSNSNHEKVGIKINAIWKEGQQARDKYFYIEHNFDNNNRTERGFESPTDPSKYKDVWWDSIMPVFYYGDTEIKEGSEITIPKDGSATISVKAERAVAIMCGRNSVDAGYGHSYTEFKPTRKNKSKNVEWISQEGYDKDPHELSRHHNPGGNFNYLVKKVDGMKVKYEQVPNEKGTIEGHLNFYDKDDNLYAYIITDAGGSFDKNKHPFTHQLYLYGYNQSSQPLFYSDGDAIKDSKNSWCLIVDVRRSDNTIAVDCNTEVPSGSPITASVEAIHEAGQSQLNRYSEGASDTKFYLDKGSVLQDKSFVNKGWNEIAIDWTFEWDNGNLKVFSKESNKDAYLVKASAESTSEDIDDGRLWINWYVNDELVDKDHPYKVIKTSVDPKTENANEAVNGEHDADKIKEVKIVAKVEYGVNVKGKVIYSNDQSPATKSTVTWGYFKQKTEEKPASLSETITDNNTDNDALVKKLTVDTDTDGNFELHVPAFTDGVLSVHDNTQPAVDAAMDFVADYRFDGDTEFTNSIVLWRGGGVGTKLIIPEALKKIHKRFDISVRLAPDGKYTEPIQYGKEGADVDLKLMPGAKLTVNDQNQLAYHYENEDTDEYLDANLIAVPEDGYATYYWQLTVDKDDPRYITKFEEYTIPEDGSVESIELNPVYITSGTVKVNLTDGLSHYSAQYITDGVVKAEWDITDTYVTKAYENSELFVDENNNLVINYDFVPQEEDVNDKPPVPENEKGILKPIAKDGFEFVSWSIDKESNMNLGDEPYIVKIGDVYQVQANFKAIEPPTPTPDPEPQPINENVNGSAQTSDNNGVAIFMILAVLVSSAGILGLRKFYLSK